MKAAAGAKAEPSPLKRDDSSSWAAVNLDDSLLRFEFLQNLPNLTLLRLARLVRIFRMVRVFLYIKELFLLLS